MRTLMIWTRTFVMWMKMLIDTDFDVGDDVDFDERVLRMKAMLTMMLLKRLMLMMTLTMTFRMMTLPMLKMLFMALLMMMLILVPT